MLKLKQELKISNLFLWGSVGLEGKMNDERMISQTPILVLSCWLASSAASQWGSEKKKTGQVCPAQKACMEESERMLPCLFIVARGSDQGRMARNILIDRKYMFRTKIVKINQHQTIIWYSFCYARICPGEWDRETPLGFWHTNGSPNLNHMARPYNNQQKRENLKDYGLCCPGWPQSKIERKWEEG